jgi:hypothetical protein
MEKLINPAPQSLPTLRENKEKEKRSTKKIERVNYYAKSTDFIAK